MDLETEKYVKMLEQGVSESKVRRELDRDGFDPDFFFTTIKASHRSGSLRAPPPAPKRSYTSSTRERGRYDIESFGTDSRSDSQGYYVESIPNSSFRKSLAAAPTKLKAFRVAVGHKLSSAYNFVRRKGRKPDRRRSVESTGSIMPPPSTPPPPRLPRRPTYMLSTTWMNKFIGRTSTEYEGGYNRKQSYQSDGEYEPERVKRKPSILDKLTGFGRRKESVETDEEPLPPPVKTSRVRKRSPAGETSNLATRKSSLGQRFSVARITNRFRTRGATKRLTGLDQSPGVAQRVKAFKAKIASDETVNNHVPVKKVRRKMSTFMAPVTAPPKELEEVAKSGAVKKNLQKFKAHNEKMRREESRVRKAVKKTLERNVVKFEKPSPSSTKPPRNGHNRTLYKGKKWSVPRSPGIQSKQSSTPESNNSRRSEGRTRRKGSLSDYIEYSDGEYSDDEYSFYSDNEDEEQLPEGWLRDYSEEWEEWFYVNLVTEESTWIKPTERAR